MKKMNKIKCWLRAIPFFIKSGVWVPHVYTCTYENAIIVATEDSFRTSKDYRHDIGETLYPDACLITYTCQRCGHKTYGWIQNWDERYKLEE